MKISEYELRQLHNMRSAIQELRSGIISISQLYIKLESLWHLMGSESSSSILPIDEINELEVLNALNIEDMINREDFDASVELVTQRIDERLAQYLALNREFES